MPIDTSTAAAATPVLATAKAHYTKQELAITFRELGLRSGDTVFFHVCLDSLGHMEGCGNEIERDAAVYAAMRQAVGDEGTILVPTYTFSFCRQEVFDVANTPTPGGPWSTSPSFLEYVRALPGAVRSMDPIHSVCGVGPAAASLLTGLPSTCFGPGCLHERLLESRAKICMIGVGLYESSFRHYVEEIIGVPFRFRKLFTGQIRQPDGMVIKTGWVYNVRILSENGAPDGSRLEQTAVQRSISRLATVGSGQLTVIDCDAYRELILEAISDDPWSTASGPAGDPVALERERVPAKALTATIPANASMGEMIEALWRIPRDIVSDGYDVALDALSTQIPMKVHRYESGTECWSWIVPEKWTCHEAYLETTTGKRLFSYADNPLHVVSYSLPFDGIVDREELLRHLYVHPHIKDAIPFQFKYYERDWGLCCSQTVRDQLQDESYRVVIRSDFSYGQLKVGEVVAYGASDTTVVLCAHLCHPAMVNDDLSGVVVGMEVMRRLLSRKHLHYTYRFLIVPETIGSVAWLSQNKDVIPKMKGGLFLEMLGLDTPHALQLSFTGETHIDSVFTSVLKERDPDGWIGEFRTVIGNDERQFNAPGVRVPMLSLSRVLKPSETLWPYQEYHSSFDTPEICSPKQLDRSVETVLAMIDALEADPVPFNKYDGEIFCSRYGIHIDALTNPEGHKALFDILYLIDGSRSIAQIAERCRIPYSAAAETIKELVRHGLIECRPTLGTVQ
jgi:aminopeptidase-like protein/aminoglycoside N3'-acetyltransferase